MSTPASKSRRQFIKYGLAGAVGFGIATAIEVPFLGNDLINANSTVNTKNQQISQLQNQAQQIPQLQNQALDFEAIRTLSQSQVSELESIVETIIPTDENGPGAKEAGVLYFIDKQLTGDYGSNAKMYMNGPFVQAGTTGPLTVQGITYPEGAPAEPFGGPTYQYNLTLKEFWRLGLDGLQQYANSAYGGNFETLSGSQKVQVLTDLFNNKPTNFKISTVDFFSELIFMTWSGFLMDPMHGGNKQMVGWKLVGFTGTNMGNAYNEGLNPQTLMVAGSPTRLQPASTGQYQKALGFISGGT